MVANPALAFLLREHGAEYRKSLRPLARDRLLMAQQLASLPGLMVFPSQGNFIMVGAASEAPPDNVVSPGHGWGDAARPGGVTGPGEQDLPAASHYAEARRPEPVPHEDFRAAT